MARVWRKTERVFSKMKIIITLLPGGAKDVPPLSFALMRKIKKLSSLNVTFHGISYINTFVKRLEKSFVNRSLSVYALWLFVKAFC